MQWKGNGKPAYSSEARPRGCREADSEERGYEKSEARLQSIVFCASVLFFTTDHTHLIIGLNKLTRVEASRISIGDVCKLLIDRSWNGSPDRGCKSGRSGIHRGLQMNSI